MALPRVPEASDTITPPTYLIVGRNKEDATFGDDHPFDFQGPAPTSLARC